MLPIFLVSFDQPPLQPLDMVALSWHVEKIRKLPTLASYLVPKLRLASVKQSFTTGVPKQSLGTRSVYTKSIA